jgi:hypothetical protein
VENIPLEILFPLYCIEKQKRRGRRKKRETSSSSSSSSSSSASHGGDGKTLAKGKQRFSHTEKKREEQKKKKNKQIIENHLWNNMMSNEKMEVYTNLSFESRTHTQIQSYKYKEIIFLYHLNISHTFIF